MHPAVSDFIEENVAYLDRSVHRSFLEIGSLDVNGSIRSYFPWADTYVGLDIKDGPGVDIVADAATWQPDRLYDVVVSTEVLEHAKRWRHIVDTAYEALRPGGVLILTCATDGRGAHNAHGAAVIDEAEEYYHNVGLAEFMVEIGRRFAESELRGTCGADLQFRGVKPLPGTPLCNLPGIRWRPRS